MTLYYDSDDVQLHHGDALTVARTLPDGMARTIVTSPPYFGLRDYGEDGQIGAESSVGQYVARIIELFRELRRVLADDGTLWLNLGDSFASGGRTSYAIDPKLPERAHLRPVSDLPAKNLLGIPWRVALALQEDGWVLRSDIIWHKPNAMPESVTDRPTKSHEYVFLLSKRPDYFYDAAAIAEDAEKGSAGSSFTTGKTAVHGLGRSSTVERAEDGKRNKRDVWTVSTVSFPGSHFAVYPPELIRPCIRAGSEPGDIVLDPFSGSGTTGAVATFEGRRYVGIDLNRDYLDLSLRTRFQQPTLPW
ncbi:MULTISPECIES: site-specific DNA-methyltransferase [unclassified Microbacterium]|uniref:DNA-methyltransferase n=1 Tax=unclassified Microbacterium TaxID=2609290 RepID=UPI0024683BBF|nr:MULTISPECIES: site-specific DNA-methyltransferase [unclassified Microbacterium]MDH5134040.1 site-specific DNA-methyltransferase [Microbacterium sp. RD10]MDH5136856.1 site-specific DNA-methyltransferase [Microbacterium sp. RD11]MDH5146880.1 site-specific DNA-methyltransferase [Microbacterium sp. RD12]MDH5156594.1 site-specific DNA-methyltransferase [Microbacterium sp. RD06]MDH5168067.1 site-specific DNA-methyltransferase [Microbacterium sp. RD02]